MRVCALALLWTFGLVAAAQEPVTDASDTDEPQLPDRAEYIRLSQELQKLALRNAWSGVERTFLKMEATGSPFLFEDLVSGAHSARAMGNVKAVRDRLQEASRLKEARDVLEWMWEIDTAYGSVFLACEVSKKNQPELVAKAMPFDPNQARAIEFAIQQVADTCLFDGMLPGGAYTFGPLEFEVQPRVETIRLDLRNPDLPNKKKG